MTATTPRLRDDGPSSGFLAHTWAMSKRAIDNIFRQPQVLFSAIVFPMFFLVLNNLTLGRSVDLPNFPMVDSYLQFILPGNALQAVMFASTAAGNEMALDIEGGFFDRLLLSPVRRTAIVLGRLAGAATLGAFCVLLFVVVTLPFGFRIRAGVPGVLVFMAVGALLCIALGGLSVAAAIKTGSVEALQGIFPIYFVLVFLSSAFFPLDLVEADWFRYVARLNPLSVIFDSTRHLIINGWDWGQAGLALGVTGSAAAVAVVLCNLALQRRLATM